MKKYLFTIIALMSITIGYSQLKVLTNGYVGVKNSNPARSLHVTGNAVFTSGSTISSYSPYIRGTNGVTTASTPEFTWVNDSTTGVFHPSSGQIAFTFSGTEKIRMNNGSELLIVDGGTSQIPIRTISNHTEDWNYGGIVAYVGRNYTKAFAVVNNSGTPTETFRIYGSGEVWALGGHYTGSDIRLKENITPITKALDKIMLLKGVSYNYKSEVLNNPKDTITVIPTTKPTTQIGLIAQDVEVVVPEVVKTFDNGIKGIAYGNLVGLLIEAMKEQQEKINTLEQLITSCCNTPKSNSKGVNNSNTVNSILDISNPAVTEIPVLYQNNPNPFSTKTEIKYFIPTSSINAAILIFDMQGTLLKTNKLMNNGNGSLEIFGGEFKPGMYMYSLIIDGKEIDTKKMILTE